MESVSRNDPCPCGSGKKYKHCHLDKPVEVKSPRFVIPVLLALVAIGVGVYVGFVKSAGLGFSVGAGGLILVGLFALLRNPPPSKGGGDPGAINFGG